MVDTGGAKRQLVQAGFSCEVAAGVEQRLHHVSVTLARTSQLANDGLRLSVLSQASMDSTGAKVRSIGEAVNRLAGAIESISGIAQVIQSVEHISAMSQQMAAAIEQQVQVTEQVNQQIVEIAGLTETSRRTPATAKTSAKPCMSSHALS